MLGASVPSMTIVDKLHKQGGWIRTFLKQNRAKRSTNAITDHPFKFHNFVRWFIPWLGVSELEKTIVNISAVIESIENKTIDAIWALQIEVSSLSQKGMTKQNGS